MDNLVLVGFRCSGKTTLGRNVARRLRMQFVDSDRFIEEMTGRTILQIFREDGEAAFRAFEREAIGRIMAERNQVVSTGGTARIIPPETPRRRRDDDREAHAARGRPRGAAPGWPGCPGRSAKRAG